MVDAVELLKSLSEMSGAPGREERVRDLVRGQVEQHCDRITEDALGNLICFKAATRHSSNGAPRVLVAAHMDEIGFYVRHVDANGFLRVHDVGSFDPRSLLARRVRVMGKRDLVGVMTQSGKPVHVATAEERKKLPRINDLIIDLGLEADEVKELVRPGDPVTLEQTFVELGDHVTGKALDNRVSCWLGVRLLQQLADPAVETYVAFTVQEEVGIRGAGAAAFRVEPDYVIGLDVTLAADIPGVSEEDHVTSLGGGVAIKVADRFAISDRTLVDRAIELAEREDVRYQLEVLPIGGTDAAVMQRVRMGAKTVGLSVPTRYVHTTSEMASKKDLDAALRLLLALCTEGLNAA